MTNYYGQMVEMDSQGRSADCRKLLREEANLKGDVAVSGPEQECVVVIND